MTAPAEEIVEQQADDWRIAHAWCWRCAEASAKPKALCGISASYGALQRGRCKPFNDKCVVCADLWELEGCPLHGWDIAP